MSPGPADISPLTRSAAISHHWLVRHRGGERVLRAIRELLPDAPVYTLVCDPEYTRSAEYRLSESDDTPVIASALQSVPGSKKHYPKLLPLMPWAARRMKLPPVDLVVCSDAALAKAMTPDAASCVMCYCHSPMRYVYEEEIGRQYRASLPAVFRPFWKRTIARVQRADVAAAARVDRFIANSRHVAVRIRRCYERDSVVIHPPVEIPAEPTPTPREDYYLAVGHHTPYKRLDLAVDACMRLGRRLVVIGEGVEVDRLRAARPTGVEFLGHVPDATVHEHYRRARGLLFPGEEDFGIVPVEATARGCPVIAFGVGGATETVADGKTGVLFECQTVDALITAIERREQLDFDSAAMHAHTLQFGHERFLREMRAVLENSLASRTANANR